VPVLAAFSMIKSPNYGLPIADEYSTCQFDLD
jgi:hypothetical protein